MVGRRGLVGPVDLGAADAAAAHRHQALGLQDPDRLADRGIADTELLDQLVLGREAVAVGASSARMRFRSSAATVSAMRRCGTRRAGPSSRGRHEPSYEPIHEPSHDAEPSDQGIWQAINLIRIQYRRHRGLRDGRRPPTALRARAARPGAPSTSPRTSSARSPTTRPTWRSPSGSAGCSPSAGCCAWPGRRSSAGAARRCGSRPWCARRCGRTTSRAARSTWASTGSGRRSCATARPSSSARTCRRSRAAR